MTAIEEFREEVIETLANSLDAVKRRPKPWQQKNTPISNTAINTA